MTSKSDSKTSNPCRSNQRIRGKKRNDIANYFLEPALNLCPSIQFALARTIEIKNGAPSFYESLREIVKFYLFLRNRLARLALPTTVAGLIIDSNGRPVALRSLVTSITVR